MAQKKIRLEDVVLSLWGVVLAFVVQVLYDAMGDPYWTRIMPKTWWGILLAIGMSILLLSYIRRLRREGEK